MLKTMYLCEQSKAADMHAIFTYYKYILISSLFNKKLLNNWYVILRLTILSIWYRHVFIFTYYKTQWKFLKHCVFLSVVSKGYVYFECKRFHWSVWCFRPYIVVLIYTFKKVDKWLTFWVNDHWILFAKI